MSLQFKKHKLKFFAGLFVLSFVAGLLVESKANKDIESIIPEQTTIQEVIEPKPLETIEQELNSKKEDVIFFIPSNDTTQSVQNFQ